MLEGANYQGGGGGFLCSFLKIEWSDPVCWGKCPDYGDLWVNFSLKCSFRIPKIIKPPNFSSWALLFVCFNWNVSGSGLVSRNLLCPEKWWLHALSTPWLADKGHSLFGHSLVQPFILMLVFHSDET